MKLHYKLELELRNKKFFQHIVEAEISFDSKNNSKILYFPSKYKAKM